MQRRELPRWLKVVKRVKRGKVLLKHFTSYFYNRRKEVSGRVYIQMSKDINEEVLV